MRWLKFMSLAGLKGTSSEVWKILTVCEIGSLFVASVVCLADEVELAENTELVEVGLIVVGVEVRTSCFNWVIADVDVVVEIEVEVVEIEVEVVEVEAEVVEVEVEVVDTEVKLGETEAEVVEVSLTGKSSSR